MCNQCDPFFLPVPVGSQSAYRGQIERLSAAVQEGILELVEASCPWQSLASPSLPACARHVFTCSLCAQLFILERGGCSALGDQWRPLYGN
jgi:hypothetical protein